MGAIDVLLASLSSMTHVFLTSLVGYCAAIYTPKNANQPLLPLVALRLFSQMSIHVFAPALILYSTSNRMNAQLLKDSLILGMISLFQNFLSFRVSTLFRRFHDSDYELMRTVEVAVGTPNQIALPIMVMQAMCKSGYVNEDFGGDSDLCSAEAYPDGWQIVQSVTF